MRIFGICIKHNWKRNTEEIKNGTIRTCINCDKMQQYIVLGDFDRTSFWRTLLK